MFNIILAYFIGSVPFGLILSKLFGNNNLQKVGSKNIGATNVFRTQGKFLGILTFLLDFAKGFFGCAIYSMFPLFFDEVPQNDQYIFVILCLMPIIGHMFPVWLKWNGGKGISTYLGVLMFMDPRICILSIIVWLIVFSIFKVSSLAGISCTLFSFLAVIIDEWFVYNNKMLITLVSAILIIIKHKDNIFRLISGNELSVNKSPSSKKRKKVFDEED